MVISLAKKVAWITGAGTGIGRAVAIKLAQAGWTVAISARTRSHLEEVAAHVPERIYPFAMDVTDENAVLNTFTAIKNQLGAVNLAMLSAGIYERDSAFDFDSTRFARTIDVNLLGTVRCMSALLPHMLELRSGRILVVASVAGYTGLPGAAAYGASKAALNNMCEALYPELSKHNVILSVVNPGFVDTPLTQQNDFPMPFLISEVRAAEHIIRAISSSRFEIAFPWKMVLATKLLALLPARLRFSITRKMVRPHDY
ncbi:SDR family NAD(P)-dependent oxidoreductase [Brucellaceae bacterium C25G]